MVASLIIYLIFLIAFLLDPFVESKLIPPHVTLLTEVLIYALFILSLIIKNRRSSHLSFDLSLFFLFFLAISFCSFALNNVAIYQVIFSLRLLLRFYIFYLALINLNLDEGQFIRINRLIVVLFLIQLPVSAVKFSFYGIKEVTHGTLTGGGLTTIIPIIALGYLAGFYAYYKSKAVYWFFGICFILYGIVGAKAALLFLYPLTFMGLYYLIYIKGRSIKITRHIIIILVVVLLSAAAVGTIIKLNVRLNPERRIGGTVDFGLALERTKEYTTGGKFEEHEYTAGRFATTMLALNVIWKEGIAHIFFGCGPGSITDSVLGSRTNQKAYLIKESYGVTGMIYIFTEYGLFGTSVFSLIFIIFLYRSWKWYSKEVEPYWKAISLGSLVFAILNAFIFVAYNKLPVAGEMVPALFYYVMALLFCRLKGIRSKTTLLMSNRSKSNS